ncbi:MAG: zinc-ribbon domain-containing protein [Armatimonadetes bacterium]|nr:zinc-ribbon domain-containing protein [Armatimonadota bacterium]
MIELAMIKCPECHKEIIEIAGYCPKCGYKLTPDKIAEIKKKEQQAKTKLYIGFLLGFIVIFILIDASGFFTSNSQKTETSTPIVLSGQNKRIAGDNWFGCIDRKYFEKLVDYTVQKDKQAFKQALAIGILAGTCTFFKDSELVYITDTAIFSGLVKVRRKGELQEFWTNLEAVI